MLNRIAEKTGTAPLARMALMTTAAVCILGLTTAMADPGRDFKYDKDQPCAPEISNWLFGVPVVAMLGAEALRRKSARRARRPMYDRHCMGE